MPNQTYGEAGAGPGPMGGVQFGQGQALERLQQQGNRMARESQRQQPTPPQQGGQPQQQSPAPEVQPEPEAPEAPPWQLRPNYPQPEYPWRAELRAWANHPKAGPALKRLAKLANRGQ